MPPLGPEEAYIFRITHVDNVPWILDHGLRCASSGVVDPNFVPIGLKELIDKRATHKVPIPPGGTLADYVPFYFTPHSMMLLNIKTGFNGVTKRANEEIAILVSTLHKVIEVGGQFLFTDGHAYMQDSEYYDDLADLDKIDWTILKRRDFRRDNNDMDKTRRYQAEALVHGQLPASALAGIACYNQGSAGKVRGEIAARGLKLGVRDLPDWYF